MKGLHSRPKILTLYLLESPESKRRGPHVSRRRIAGRPSPSKPLDPKTFVQRLTVDLGRDSARQLVRRAFEIVEETGQPNAWIFEVRRARQRGDFSPAVANFLIFKLAESAMILLTQADPVLVKLTAEIERVERAHGLEEGEYWYVDEGPPEWQELNRQWNEAHEELLLDILFDNGEDEIARAYAAEEEALFMEGRTLIFGEDHREEGDGSAVDPESR